MNKTTNEIRRNFLSFFKKKNHIILPSSSLIPNNDSTLLFTNAGMNQFKEIFLGQKKINHLRVATVQRCLRTGGKHNDLENVGHTSKHHTFFEMLGNFSFGDYFKKEAIQYAWELLTSKKWFNIPKNKLWISVYKNDYETYNIWKNTIQVPKERIIKIGDKKNCKYDSDNFWQMGDTGPCGPSTEIFYDYGEKKITNISDFLENKNNRFVEIWNIVFIEFNRISEEKIISLDKKSIDTGMGLERISAVLQNVRSNYDIDIFQKLIKNITTFSNVKDLNNISLKIIADHIRSCAYIIADDIYPSNEHRGYVLRRIIRRALRHANKIGIKEQFLHKLINNLIEVMEDSAFILKEKKEQIKEILKKEEIQFSYTLDKGLKILNNEIKKIHNHTLPGKTVFYLYDTFGFPADLTADICREKNINIDYKNYKLLKEIQKKQSSIKNKFYKNYNNDIIINDACFFEGYEKNQTKSLVKYIFIKNQSVNEISENENGVIFLDKTPFYPESGGQIGDTGKLYEKQACFIVENTKKFGKGIGHIGKINLGKIKVNDVIYTEIDLQKRQSISINHSATHLLNASLRMILGNTIHQKGSLVTNESLRFDFSYSKKIKASQIQKIENIINMKIRDNIVIKTKQLKIEEAKEQNAIFLSQHEYNSIVRVVFINNFSIELCGGTHAKRTGDIGFFKILSQSSIASGIKRIEAITGKNFVKYLHQQDHKIQEISHLLNCQSFCIGEKIKQLINKIRELEYKNNKLQNKENTYYIKKLIKKTQNIEEAKFLSNIFYNQEHKQLRLIIDGLKKELRNTIIILINIIDNNFTFIVGVTKNLTNQISAINILKKITKETNGNGGGKQEIAEGGGVDVKKIPIILKKIKIWIGSKLKNKK